MGRLFISMTIGLLFFSSCYSDKCAVLDFGSFKMSEDIKSKNPYSGEDKIIVFKDSLDKEYQFVINENDIKFERNTLTKACPEDEMKSLEVYAKLEYHNIFMDCDMLNLKFNVQIGLAPIINLFSIEKDGIKYEGISISPTRKNILNGIVFDYVINKYDKNGNPIQDFNQTNIKTEDLTILGRNFKDVIYSSVTPKNNDILLFYTITQGIVGFKDYSSNKTYVFNRIIK